MGLYDHWPYTNIHELNLTWILRQMQHLSEVVENFVALNTIKYADPIQWNITTQYEANTVVVDPQNGTAYISTQPVPAGVGLTNTDYWSVIFTLDVISANKNITLRDDGSNVLATFGSVAGDWLLWNGTLYKVTQAINVNEAYVVGYNLDRYTVEMFISDYVTELKTAIGDLTDLNTTDKDNLVEAINEVLQTLTNTTGDLTDLNTTDKDNLVDAINELVANIGDLTTLNTTDKTSTVAAINEVYSIAQDVLEDVYYLNVKDFGATGDGITDDTAAIQSAIDAATDKSVLVFPDGTYIIDGTVNVNKSGLHLMGIGHNSIITRSSQTNTPIFFIHGSSKIDGFEADHLAFHNLADGCCFEVAWTFDSNIHDCFVKAIKCFVRYGIATETNYNIWPVVRNIIGDIKQNNSYFIDIYGYTNGLYVEDCQINSEISYTNGNFIYCHPYTPLDTLVLTNNLVQRINYGLNINNVNAGGVVQNIFLTDNIFDSMGVNALIVRSEINQTLCRIMSDHNWYNTPELNSGGIPVVYTSTLGRIVQVHHNNDYFLNMPTRAMLFQGASTSGISNVKITDCTFNGFNRETAGGATQSCITIGNVAGRDYIISNNMFAPSADITANNTYGIYVETGIGYVALNGNMLRGITTPLTGTVTVASGNVPTSINT